jgi:hypothetical protein
MSPPQTNPEQRSVFEFGVNKVTLGEVMDAAFFLGLAQPLWSSVKAAALAVELADAKGLEMDLDALQTLSEEFRYQRSLITSEETEAWLAARDLTTEDWENHLIRQYWSKRAGRRPDPVADLPPPSGPAERELLRQEMLFSGSFAGLAKQFSRRVAAFAATGDPRKIGPDRIQAERRRWAERAAVGEESLADWLARLGRDDAWVDALARMECAFQAERDALLTPAVRQQTLAALRLQLTRLDIEMMELDSLQAAREAFLCLTEDGIPMARLAEEVRYPYRRAVRLVDELAADLQQSFVVAELESVIGPIQRRGGFELHRILAKLEPTLEDPVVRECVDRRIMESHFSNLDLKAIRWILKEESAE